MKTVFTLIRKELLSYLNHPMGYLFIVVFLAVNNFFFFRTLLVNNVASLRPLFDFLPWLLLFLVPAVTMRLSAEERKTGTWETLLTQPVSDTAYVFGKWIAASIFVFAGILLSLISPLILSLVGDFDWGVVAGQYLGAALLVMALSAVGYFASQITKNQIIAFLIGIGISFFFIIAGLDIIVLALPPVLQTLFSNLSLSAHYQSLGRGVLDVRDLLYFVSFVVSFLSVAVLLLKAARVNRHTGSFRRLQSGVIGIVILSLLVNSFGNYLGGRVDFTENHLYTLSPATRTILGKLPDLVRIKVFVSKEAPPELTFTIRDLKDLLKDMSRRAEGKLVVSYHDPASDEAAASEAQTLGIPSLQFNVLRQDEFQVKQGYFGLAVLYADSNEVIPYINDTSNLEYQLVSFIRKLTNPSRNTVAFLTGQGEKSPSGEYAALGESLRNQFDIREVDLSDTTQTVTATTTLVIAGPSQELPSAVNTSTAAFLRNGGNALVLLDGVSIDLQMLSVSPREGNGSVFLQGSGVTLNADLLADLRSFENVTFGGGPINYILPYPYWMRTIPNQNHAVTRGLETIMMPWASSLSISPQEGVTIEPLIQTTEFAHRSTGPTFNIAPNQEFGSLNNNLGTHPTAVAITFPQVSGGPTGRMIVVADSDFLSDQYVRNAPNNLAFGLNAIDWLSQDETLLQIRSKNRAESPLLFSTDSQKATIKYLNMIGLPLLVALAGVVRLWMRRRKTKQKFI